MQTYLSRLFMAMGRVAIFSGESERHGYVLAVWARGPPAGVEFGSPDSARTGRVHLCIQEKRTRELIRQLIKSALMTLPTHRDTRCSQLSSCVNARQL